MNPDRLATQGMPRFMREHTRANPFLLAEHMKHGAPICFDHKLFLPNTAYSHELGVYGVYWKIMALDILIYRLKDADADITYEEGFEAELIETTNARKHDVEDTIDDSHLISEAKKAIYRQHRNQEE